MIKLHTGFVHRMMNVNGESKMVSYIGSQTVTIWDNKKMVRVPRSNVHPLDIAIALGHTIGVL